MPTDARTTAHGGLHYVCRRLAELGWNAMPAPGTAHGASVVAHNHDCSQVFSVRVESLSRSGHVALGLSATDIPDGYWVIVDTQQGRPQAYVLSADDVRSLARPSGKGADLSFWLHPSAYGRDEFREAWQRIGRPWRTGHTAPRP